LISDGVKKEILGFEVTMYNAVLMTVFYASYDLLKEAPRLIFGKFAVCEDVLE
jgi:hypothetical protein